MSSSRAAHVVILGCGRSGTSIFGELFEHLSPYTYLSEPLFGDYLAQDFRRPIAVKVPAVDDRYPPTPGLPFPLETLVARVPGEVRFYWAVRHPLDVICSLRPGIANNWGHHPKPPDWRDWLERPLLERCAHHWSYLNTVGFAAVRHLAKPKRFEEMLQDPRAFADSVCEEIGVDVGAHDAGLAEWSRRVQDTNNEHFVEAKTSRSYSRPDHERRVGRWRENLSAQDVALLRPMVAPAAEQFGYRLDET